MINDQRGCFVKLKVSLARGPGGCSAGPDIVSLAGGKLCSGTAAAEARQYTQQKGWVEHQFVLPGNALLALWCQPGWGERCNGTTAVQTLHHYTSRTFPLRGGWSATLIYQACRGRLNHGLSIKECFYCRRHPFSAMLVDGSAEPAAAAAAASLQHHVDVSSRSLSTVCNSLLLLLLHRQQGKYSLL